MDPETKRKREKRFAETLNEAAWYSPTVLDAESTASIKDELVSGSGICVVRDAMTMHQAKRFNVLLAEDLCRAAPDAASSIRDDETRLLREDQITDGMLMGFQAKALRMGSGIGSGFAARFGRSRSHMARVAHQVFADFFGVAVGDLATSFDCVGLATATNHVKPEDWLHVDQMASSDPGIQGALYVKDAGVKRTNVVAFVAVPHSHKTITPQMAALWDKTNHATSVPPDWALLRRLEELGAEGMALREEAVGSAVRLCVPARGLLLWNSSVVHANVPGPTGHGDGQLRRLLMMVTARPVLADARLRAKARKRMMAIYLTGRTSTHFAERAEVNGAHKSLRRFKRKVGPVKSRGDFNVALRHIDAELRPAGFQHPSVQRFIRQAGLSTAREFNWGMLSRLNPTELARWDGFEAVEHLLPVDVFESIFGVGTSEDSVVHIPECPIPELNDPERSSPLVPLYDD